MTTLARQNDAQARILSLDVIRGIAVMGIFAANVIGMALIENANFYPPDYGFSSALDHIAWAVNFILVDGRFRALFSILFGASMLLVIDRAESAGRSGGRVHFARMAVLLLFGLAHYYLLWWGDILVNYALVGMAAFFLRRLQTPGLIAAAIIALALYNVPTITLGGQQLARYEAMRAPDATGEERAPYDRMMASLVLTPEKIATDKAAHADPAAHFRQMTAPAERWLPFLSVETYGLETLGLMLLGMAGYRSGFLTGEWRRRQYAVAGMVLSWATLPLFALGAISISGNGFDRLTYDWWTALFLPLLQPLSALGYAALIMAAMHGREAGAVIMRIAAVGRAAFTNYLGATILGVLIFYDFAGGLYGDLSRGQAWLITGPVWALMLLWSQPWLARFRYGPFEWAWRSLARGRWEAMRRPPTPSVSPQS